MARRKRQFDVAQYERWKAQTPGSKLERLLLGQILLKNEALIQLYVSRVCFTYRTPVDEDAMQAGRIGCIIALRRFDPTKGAFTTHSWHWIRREVQQHLLVHTQETCKKRGAILTDKHMKNSREIFKATGRNATAAELGADPVTVFLQAQGVHFTELQRDPEDGKAEALWMLDPKENPEERVHAAHVQEAAQAYVDGLPEEERENFRTWYREGTLPRGWRKYIPVWEAGIRAALKAEKPC